MKSVTESVLGMLLTAVGSMTGMLLVFAIERHRPKKPLPADEEVGVPETTPIGAEEGGQVKDDGGEERQHRDEQRAEGVEQGVGGDGDAEKVVEGEEEGKSGRWWQVGGLGWLARRKRGVEELEGPKHVVQVDARDVEGLVEEVEYREGGGEVLEKPVEARVKREKGWRW
ncbi:hypothetical protein TI39_contig367g00021 [Zymoseptoria brevis]|uniref:Uncharacterized protein n=1 Tax=Zymoseptoria brevis TaxID=1047168 RepID=A0A0F4GP84_9PEZI|nr:hypothetical protein TI39_contig367g00021 [Zymoseptoria brevis]